MRTPEGVVLGHLPLKNKENKKIVGIFYPHDSLEVAFSNLHDNLE